MAAHGILSVGRGRMTLALVVVLGVGTVITACTQTPPEPKPSHAVTAPAQTQKPTPSPTPTSVPVLHPDQSAAGNLAYFNHVNQALLARKPKAKGRDFIDALTAAGFSKSAMQVTADATTIGLVAQSIQFSVEINGGCLIGQLGTQTGYRSEVTPVLATGKCLIGETRPINW